MDRLHWTHLDYVHLRNTVHAVLEFEFLRMRIERIAGSLIWILPSCTWSYMPLPFSVDLRWRIVWLSLTTDRTPANIAHIMNVSELTVWRYISLFKQTGDIQPMLRRNGSWMLMGDFEQITLLIVTLEILGYICRRFRTSCLTFLEYQSVCLQSVGHWKTWDAPDRQCIEWCCRDQML